MEEKKPATKPLDPRKMYRNIYKRSYYKFFKDFWDTVESHKMVDAPYIKYICDEVQTVFNWVADFSTQTDGYDLLINIAPGTSKSSIISKFGPAYLWVLNPDIQMIASSYSSGPVKEFTFKFKKLLESDKFRQTYPELTLQEDNVGTQRSQGKGARYTTSTGGSVTSLHGDILTIDDSSKPPAIKRDENGNPKLEQGATLTEILAANSWHDDSFVSRKTDKEKSRIIYVQQRLHRQDMSGYILNKALKQSLRLKHICLPAEINPNSTEVQAYSREYKGNQLIKEVDLSGLYTDGLLDHNRMNKQVLEGTKELMGSYVYNAQFLQKPSKDKGGIIKQNWFPTVDAADLPENLVKYFYTDASEGKPNSDNMATICWSLHEGKMYVWEILAVVKPFNEFIGHRDSTGKWIDKEYDLFLKKHGATKQSKCLFEAKSTGTPYIQYINANTEYNAIPDTPHGSKMDRVNISTGTWEAGKVVFVKGVPNTNSAWIGATLEELGNFAGRDGDVDDRVDVLTAATKVTRFNGSSFILAGTSEGTSKEKIKETDYLL